MQLRTALALASVISSASLAQSNDVFGPTVVILGIEQQMPGVRASIHFKPGVQPEAVIKVSIATVTEGDLAEAFTLVRRVRKDLKSLALERTQTTETMGVINLTGSASTRPLSVAERRAYRGYIESFRHAREVDVPRVGKGKAVEVRIE